ncbi:MAG: hypothetical protein F4X72_08155 [Dehalococcoidia bacterium]|nr:hypothetical protein [Dehalococcoidia bacterium]
MLAKPTIHIDEDDVEEQLAKLGLTLNSLHEALRAGYEAKQDLTKNDPIWHRAPTPTAKIIRGLREQLIPQGWIRSDAKGLATIIHPDGHLSIGVAAGDKMTGLDTEVQPRTRSRKGPATKDAISINQLRFEGMLPEISPPSTRILLFRIASNTIKAELSLPASIGEDEHISEWSKRIILPDMKLTTAIPTPTPVPVPVPATSIKVPRKAQSG